ncbi:hypothetical protein G1C96_1601 [Bifidobacterium sp. DSM 109958]|uniref:Uncharacterized protein n=1 Tax=Bifidobacterium moraviense TaxID=2675323 RepID=A0A7Y0F2V5_9BIFI|nr:hypothetical protein [Bifidobacterium sp. DSM 109958]NMN01019.1 hypothetical protein [Bifidobacterium sp. DSM 109958]
MQYFWTDLDWITPPKRFEFRDQQGVPRVLAVRHGNSRPRYTLNDDSRSTIAHIRQGSPMHFEHFYVDLPGDGISFAVAKRAFHIGEYLIEDLPWLVRYTRDAPAFVHDFQITDTNAVPVAHLRFDPAYQTWVLDIADERTRAAVFAVAVCLVRFLHDDAYNAGVD